MIRPILLSCLVLAPLAACGPSYSPDTYSANAVQQANKAEQGIIIGVRPVKVSAAGAVGTVTGAAAGGIAGSQATAAPLSAFTALGGSLVGGIAGSAVEHATADTDAFEYIVKKNSGELVSVTQKDAMPLAVGLKVLVIAGSQARVVQDYTDPALAPSVKQAAAQVAKAPADATPPQEARPAEAEPSGAASSPGASPSGASPLGVPSSTVPSSGAPSSGAPSSTASPSGAVVPADKSPDKPAVEQL